ncbi:hypothetical protein GQ607_011484, partial [Colletotrichum asianum]
MTSICPAVFRIRSLPWRIYWTSPSLYPSHNTFLGWVCQRPSSNATIGHCGRPEALAPATGLHDVLRSANSVTLSTHQQRPSMIP